MTPKVTPQGRNPAAKWRMDKVHNGRGQGAAEASRLQTPRQRHGRADGRCGDPSCPWSPLGVLELGRWVLTGCHGRGSAAGPLEDGTQVDGFEARLAQVVEAREHGVHGRLQNLEALGAARRGEWRRGGQVLVVAKLCVEHHGGLVVRRLGRARGRHGRRAVAEERRRLRARRRAGPREHGRRGQGAHGRTHGRVLRALSVVLEEEYGCWGYDCGVHGWLV